jgi:hypothetical protein
MRNYCLFFVFLILLRSDKSFATGCDFKVVGPFEGEDEGTASAGLTASVAFEAEPLDICEPGKCNGER